jgi:hypothetical protein
MGRHCFGDAGSAQAIAGSNRTVPDFKLTASVDIGQWTGVRSRTFKGFLAFLHPSDRGIVLLGTPCFRFTLLMPIHPLHDP